jgi:expansin (peptidoglycan-binding protein)
MKTFQFEVGDRITCNFNNVNTATIVGYSTDGAYRIMAASYDTRALVVLPDDMRNLGSIKVNQGVSGPKGTVTVFASSCSPLKISK